MARDPLPATCRCRALGIAEPVMREEPERDPIKSKRIFVAPAEAGVQGHRHLLWVPAFAGTTIFIRLDRPLVTVAVPIVSVEDLRVRFVMSDTTVHAVNGISFALEA